MTAAFFFNLFEKKMNRERHEEKVTGIFYAYSSSSHCHHRKSSSHHTRYFFDVAGYQMRWLEREKRKKQFN